MTKITAMVAMVIWGTTVSSPCCVRGKSLVHCVETAFGDTNLLQIFHEFAQNSPTIPRVSRFGEFPNYSRFLATLTNPIKIWHKVKCSYTTQRWTCRTSFRTFHEISENGTSENVNKSLKSL